MVIREGYRANRGCSTGIGDDVELMVDAHGILDVSTAIRMARRMEPYGIEGFEEPILPDDHRGLAGVRRATEISIASGEREFTQFEFRDLFEHNAIDIAQPDIARVGGVTELRRVVAMTSSHGVRVAPHAWENGVLFAASMHAAMAVPNCHILEVSQAYKPMLYDLFDEDFDISGGLVTAPDRPGLGFTLRDDFTDHFGYTDGRAHDY